MKIIKFIPSSGAELSLITRREDGKNQNRNFLDFTAICHEKFSIIKQMARNAVSNLPENFFTPAPSCASVRGRVYKERIRDCESACGMSSAPGLSTSKIDCPGALRT